MSAVTKRTAALLVMVSVVFTSVAQLLFSFVMKGSNVGSMGMAEIFTSLPAAGILYLGLGIVLYAVSMLVWIFALTRFPVSLAYPMLSISYVLVYLAATWLPFLNESASTAKSIGVLFVVAGVSVLFLDERLRKKGDANSGQ